MKRTQAFEDLYRTRPEPYDYSRRATEVLRHRFVVETVGALQPRPSRILDVGCSLGQLTRRLGSIPEVTFAMDVSGTAVKKARFRCEGTGARFRFAVGSATALPFRDHERADDQKPFDLVVLCDGLVGWNLSLEERAAALAEAHRVLRPGGTLLLTEFLRPKRFAGFVREVEQSPFQIVRINYLHDRLWYQVEAWFKRIRGRRRVQGLFASVPFALALHSIARLFGKYGAKHICIVAQKSAQSSN